MVEYTRNILEQINFVYWLKSKGIFNDYINWMDQGKYIPNSLAGHPAHGHI